MEGVGLTEAVPVREEVRVGVGVLLGDDPLEVEGVGLAEGQEERRLPRLMAEMLVAVDMGGPAVDRAAAAARARDRRLRQDAARAPGPAGRP